MSKSPINPPVLDTKLVEAAQWRMRLAEHETSPVDVDAWRAADLANEHAWQQVQASWLLLGEHAAEPELLVLREQALGHAREARESRALSFGVRPWHRSLKALAAMLVLLLAGGSSYYVIFKHADTYATRAGERRTITLSDGSQLVLDSRTEVRVRYSRSERDVQLVGGQARFNVSKDASRPFVVHAGGQWVRAVGTAFNVDLLGDTLAVTLIEGRVRVRRDELARARRRGALAHRGVEGVACGGSNGGGALRRQPVHLRARARRLVRGPVGRRARRAAVRGDEAGAALGGRGGGAAGRDARDDGDA